MKKILRLRRIRGSAQYDNDQSGVIPREVGGSSLTQVFKEIPHNWVLVWRGEF